MYIQHKPKLKLLLILLCQV